MEQCDENVLNSVCEVPDHLIIVQIISALVKLGKAKHGRTWNFCQLNLWG